MSTQQQLTSLNVSLPRSQKSYVQKAATATGCSTPSEYIRRLIHADQQARAQQTLEQALLEGLASGQMQKLTATDWADIRREVATRLKRKQRTAR